MRCSVRSLPRQLTNEWTDESFVVFSISRKKQHTRRRKKIVRNVRLSVLRHEEKIEKRKRRCNTTANIYFLLYYSTRKKQKGRLLNMIGKNGIQH